MPIYDVSYHRFGGRRTSRWARSWAVARSGLVSLVRERRFLLLLGVGWLPAVIRGGQIYVARQFPQATLFEVTPALWKDFLTQQVSLWLVVLVALYAGSGAVASDLKTGAVILYLSKPLSRMDYLLGKAAPVLLALLAITLIPAEALLVLHLLLADNVEILRQAPWLPICVIAYSIWVGAYFSLSVLAVSSLSRSPRLAAAGFVVVIVGSYFLQGVADRMSFGRAPPYVSLLGAAVATADVFFGRGGADSLVSLAYTALLMTASCFLMDRRLRSAGVAS